MIRLNKAVAAAGIACLAAVSVATTAEARNDKRSGGDLSSSSSVSRNLSVSGTQSISAPNVRIALHFDYEYGITRSKGVTLIRNPSVGLYCVRPSSMTSSTVAGLVPQVTVDFSASSGSVLLAYYRSAASGCQSNEIGVQTRRLNTSGTFVNSNAVGWTLIAP
jgi:hypothetical protein